MKVAKEPQPNIQRLHHLNIFSTNWICLFPVSSGSIRNPWKRSCHLHCTKPPRLFLAVCTASTCKEGTHRKDCLGEVVSAKVDGKFRWKSLSWLVLSRISWLSFTKSTHDPSPRMIQLVQLGELMFCGKPHETVVDSSECLATSTRYIVGRIELMNLSLFWV